MHRRHRFGCRCRIPGSGLKLALCRSDRENRQKSRSGSCTKNLSYLFCRDLANGCYIAELLARYFPGSIPLHSFENVTSVQLKDANWHLLRKILQVIMSACSQPHLLISHNCPINPECARTSQCRITRAHSGKRSHDVSCVSKQSAQKAAQKTESLDHSLARLDPLWILSSDCAL